MLNKITNIKSFLYLGLCLSVTVSTLSSCKKFLDLEPKEGLENKQVYRNLYDADAAVIGVYGKLMNLAEQHVVLNELRADLLTVTDNTIPALREINENDVSKISSENPYISPKKFYEVILNCNDVLKNFIAMRDESKLDLDQFKERYSDVLAIRTWVYLQLGIHYGSVPYVTDALEDIDAVLDKSKYPILEFSALLDKLIADAESMPYKEFYSSGSSLLTQVDGYSTERLFINKNALLGDLYLWKGDYNAAARAYKDVMTAYDNLGKDDFRFDRFKMRWAEVSSNNDLSVGYLRYRTEDVTTLVNSTSQGWRSIFSRGQDALWDTEWVWTLPFSPNFKPENPFIKLFADNGGSYQLKPSQHILDLWNNETQANNVPYDARKTLSVSTVNGKDFVTKYLDEYSSISNQIPIDKFSKKGKWFLYRQSKLHLRFIEAANRDHKYKLANSMLNNGIGNNYDNPNVSDKTDVMQTHLPPPYDFDARYGTVPFLRGTWHRNTGVRGRAYLQNKPLANPADSLISIEDNLINEAALELAFEGSRWEDLLRIAIRRNDPSFLADKIYLKHLKSGNPNADAVRAKLMDRKNWYLPFKWK